MASTRRRPLDIYQDPESSTENTHPERDVEAELLRALAPLSDASNKANVQLNPSTTTGPGSSPSKKDSSPLRPISSHHLKSYRLSPPRRPNFKTDSPKKNGGFYSMYQQVAPRPERALYPQQDAYDKENVFEGAPFGDLGMPIPYSGTTIPYSEADYGSKGALKRTFMDAAPMKPPVKKQRLGQEEYFELPNPDDMPSIVDDGQKPPHSYAELIGMAILRAPQRKLTLAQIYKWISENFTFYRSSEGGWQNSIRHNLSLNKNFIKQERPKDDPGKGNYWAIKPGEERPFLLGKKQPVRRMVNQDGSQYGSSLAMTSDPIHYRPSTAPAVGNFTLGPNPPRKVETKDIDSAKFPDDTELSSEGTIPASDPALQDDEKDDTAAMPPPPLHLRSSPPPHDLGSSPPTLGATRGGTPPPASRYPPSSRSGGQRRKFAGLNDSGYWSSIESSAARGATNQLASETDVRSHRIKKGRAEAEIARIRSSSFDSPSKESSRYHHGHSGSFGSSPVHRDDNPLTPAVVFKRPVKPPAAVSPNTNLRDHRNAVRALLGSPSKTLSPIGEPNVWSPAFTLGEDAPTGLTPFISPYKQSKTPWRPLGDTPNAAFNYTSAAFDVFIDAPEEDIIARGSPEKRSNRRPSLARAATSTGILADITGTAKSNNLMLAPSSASPFSFSPFLTRSGQLKSPAKLDSPLKHMQKPPSSDAPSIDMSWFDVVPGPENSEQPAVTNDIAGLFGLEPYSDGSEEGIDLFQDFGKIGQTSQAMPAPDRSTGSPVRRTNMGPPARPSLGRSTSNRW